MIVGTVPCRTIVAEEAVIVSGAAVTAKVWLTCGAARSLAAHLMETPPPDRLHAERPTR